MKYDSKQKGFTLIEVVVGSAVFLVVAMAAYGAFTSLFKLANLNQTRLTAIQLANEQFEIVRNMPYTSIGIVGGVPAGTIPATQTLTRGGVAFTVSTTIRNIDLPFDGTIGGNPKFDSNPADNKLVQFTISCATCQNFSPITMTSQVAPKSLETTSSNRGALGIQVFDANGNNVSGASVRVTNASTTSPVTIDDTTDIGGSLQLLDLPADINAYHVVVTKSGYSTDRTSAIDNQNNPTPTKPDSTVVSQRLTQISFAIDKVSSLTFTSVTPTCTSTPSFHFSLIGQKTIGLNLPKYSSNPVTGFAGSVSIPSLEWDTYTLTPTDSVYDLAGMNPSNPISLKPNTNQTIQLVIVPKSTNSLLVTVKDAGSSLTLTDATVLLSGPGFSETQTTIDGTQSDPISCVPAGQVLFTGMSPGTYTLSISKTGYTSTTRDITIGAGWSEQQFLLGH